MIAPADRVLHAPGPEEGRKYTFNSVELRAVGVKMQPILPLGGVPLEQVGAVARARRVLRDARVRGVWLHRVGGVGRGVLGQRARVLARRVGGGVTLRSGGVSR